MQEDPAGVLKIMHNAGRMLPFVDSRMAWLKFAIMYARELGIKLDYSNYQETIINILNKFEKDLGQDLAVVEYSAAIFSLPPQSSSGLSVIVSSPPRDKKRFCNLSVPHWKEFLVKSLFYLSVAGGETDFTAFQRGIAGGEYLPLSDGAWLVGY